MTPWQFWIDVGGTFTDCLARAPDGTLHRAKVLSSGATKGVVGDGSSMTRLVDPARRGEPAGFWHRCDIDFFDSTGQRSIGTSIASFDATTGTLTFGPALSKPIQSGMPYELRGDDEAPILAIRRILGLAPGARLPPLVVKLGTTRGTNALLTRRGANCAFVTTRGFGDILRIGYQNRPKLFALDILLPPPLYMTTLEIDERITVDGEILIAPDETRIREDLLQLRANGIESLAICLLNGYCQPRHEELVSRIAREIGFDEISLSSAVAPLIKLVARGQTTVVDAYLNPVLRSYVAKIRAGLASSPSPELKLMTSAGGLVAAERFTGKDSLLSGPAGGVVGFARSAEACGFPRAIGFDMGGTSTDVARYDGRFELEQETEKAGVRVMTPLLAIHTVAAGGGSICRYDGTRLLVGPASAGADPGPACYGRGGPLTVTDCNVYLGRVPAAEFPFPLNVAAAERQLQNLADELQRSSGRTWQLPELAASLIDVANATMVKAIRAVSVARGYDPRDYPLVAFGGAAGQHACAMARELGITSILAPVEAGLLSALGIGLADVVRQRMLGMYRLYDAEARIALEGVFASLTTEATSDVLAEGIAADRIETVRSLDMRYRGLDASLSIDLPRNGDWAAAYHAEHQRLFGYFQANRAIEIVAARVTATGRSTTQLPAAEECLPITPAANRTVRAWLNGAWQNVPCWDSLELELGSKIPGPAIVVDFATLVIEPGWTATVRSSGDIVLTSTAQASNRRSENDRLEAYPTDAPDPARLEVFNNQIAGIAEQMGLTLRNTASSVNVKERLDYSCAIFTARGDLVVNAPHIPVHLGAMSETVKQLLADFPDIAPGDVLVTNDPFRGGSHLPDVTVVTPIHDPHSGELRFFTANRAHHAEIGGITPGSMPPFSKKLSEEGVLIRGMKVVAAGESRLDALREILLAPPYPTRNVADNLADITAQIAANRQGANELAALVARQGWPQVAAYMEHIQRASERMVRQALAQLPQGTHRFTDHLDDGSPICVAVTLAGGEATFDFAGTGPVLAGNLNANRAIVTAAVMYVLRCLLGNDQEREIPLNQGVLAPVKILIPPSLLDPLLSERAEHAPAVVGGNVETSQRVVDVLLGALGLAAASQGTMNNFLFGDATFGYYETICGGSGATPQADGVSAVHTHMTNTRLTDPEVLERRYPVRVKRFAIRTGSGGAGLHRGGDGVVREIEFLRPVRVSLLTSRRGPYPPYGLAGGSPGALGKNTWLKKDGTVIELANAAEFNAEAGDVLRIETPGGGSWGEKS